MTTSDGMETTAEGQRPISEAYIDAGYITIRVPLDTLPIAFKASPANVLDDEGDPKYRVINIANFAESVVRRLNEEEEDGTTLIHIAFDAAFEQVLEQGDEGLNLEGE